MKSLLSFLIIAAILTTLAILVGVGSVITVLGSIIVLTLLLINNFWLWVEMMFSKVFRSKSLSLEKE